MVPANCSLKVENVLPAHETPGTGSGMGLCAFGGATCGDAVPQPVRAGDEGWGQLFPFTAPLRFFLSCYLQMRNAALPSSALSQPF